MFSYLASGNFLSALFENWESEFLQMAAYVIESFQNWQSEFMSTAVLVVLSIFLRQKGSPESKPVAADNIETGA
jgi:hypothetical protein